MKKRILSILLALCMLFCLVPTTAFAADCAEDLVDPVIWIHLSSDGGGYYDVLNGTWTAADFFQPGKAPKGAKITAVMPPTSPSIPVSVNVNSDGTLNCTKTENTTEPVPKSETYTVTITSDDYAPISAPLTVRQYLNAGFRGPVYFDDELLYGDTYTYTCRVNNPGENGVWSALIQDPQMFEIYKETTDTTSEPGKSIYTVHIRAIKAGARVTCIDFLYVSDTTMASSKVSRGAVTGGAVRTRPLTVTAGSATITEGNALPTDLVTCTGLLNSEGRKDDRDTVLDNALGYQLLDANNEEVTAATARNMPGTYTVVPAATLKSGWGERYSLNKVNGTLTVENQPDEQFTLAPGGRYYFDLSAMNIPGTVNSNLPDSTLHYVPFTYAGTVDAYSVKNEADKDTTSYEHSLFIADYAMTHTVSWNELNEKSLIYGKDYAGGGVTYSLRAPSAGLHYAYGQNAGGTPGNNEWDVILDKAKQGNNDNTNGYVKNWQDIYSWGQDKVASSSFDRSLRGYRSSRYWYIESATHADSTFGFRPVLELPTDLAADSLKTVELVLGKNMPGETYNRINIIVKKGESFKAPAAEGLPRPDGISADALLWWKDEKGNYYKPGDTVPAENITITAQWKINQYTITFDTAGGSEVAPITQDYNTQITAPANPTREGYAFNGWDKEIPQTMPAENITITAQWKDTEKPTGEISVGTNKWNTFLNNITFGLFFNETQTVTVDASDNSGDEVKIEYLLSAVELTEAELSGKSFTEYADAFSINPDNEYIIYVKLTDKSNNIAYISSQGIVLDGTSPVISGIDNGKTYCEAQTVTVIEKYIDTATVNGKSVTLDENNQFVISPADGKQRIVVADKVGNMASVAVTVNDGHTASEDDGDCTTPVKCIYHNDVIVIPAKQHDFSGEWHKDENEHWHSCQNSGCTISEAKTAHSGNDDNDCTTPVACECGYVLTAARSEHTWGEWVSDGNGKHTHKCTVDGCTAAETKDCGGGTATCHTKAVCDACHNEYGEYNADNHDGTLEWVQTATTHEKKWSCCKAVATAKENHSWENGICTECGYGCAHSGGTATCHTKAVCDACHNEYGEYNADNHDGGTKVSGDIKAGCTQKGYTGDTYCLGCEKILTKGTEIAASGHSGGNATCRDKAKCDVCGKSYGELNPKNHADLKHINAKAAATDAEGNIEYWYCDGCNKYFSDAAAAKEISKADTVIEKMQSYPKSPQTGYCTNLIQLWLALLFVGGGVVTGTTVIIKRRYNR